mgnify:FL=1
MNDKFRFDPVKIEWFDINASDGGWQTEDEIKNHEPAICCDVCYIYHEDADKVITFSSYNLHSDGSIDYGFLTAFPRGCIRKITKL